MTSACTLQQQADAWLTVRVDNVLCSLHLCHDFCSDSAFVCRQQSPITLLSWFRKLYVMWSRYITVLVFA